jgi:uncharacterized Fe-S center protein
MNGKWEQTVHVADMRRITAQCDCVDAAQDPMFPEPLGWLVGKNPFAVDRMAARILRRALEKRGIAVEKRLLEAPEDTAAYVEAQYGIVTETTLTRLPTGKSLVLQGVQTAD